MRRIKIRFPKNTFNAISLAIIGAAIVLLIAGTIYYVQQERQRKAIEQQTSTTNQLIKEVKSISEENRRLNKENRNFTYCTGVLFAKWTQEQQPIIIEDLNACALSSFPKVQAPSEPGQTIENFSQESAPVQSVQPAQNVQPAAPAPQQAPSPTPQPTPTPSPQPASQPLLQLNVPCLNLVLIQTCVQETNS